MNTKKALSLQETKPSLCGTTLIAAEFNGDLSAAFNVLVKRTYAITDMTRPFLLGRLAFQAEARR